MQIGVKTPHMKIDPAKSKEFFVARKVHTSVLVLPVCRGVYERGFRLVSSWFALVMELE